MEQVIAALNNDTDEVACTLIQQFKQPLTEEVLELAVEQGKLKSAVLAVTNGAPLSKSTVEKVIKHRHLRILETFAHTGKVKEIIPVFAAVIKARWKAGAEKLFPNIKKDLPADIVVMVMENGWKIWAEKMIDEGQPIDAACFLKATYMGWLSTLEKLCSRKPNDMQEGLDRALNQDAVWSDKYQEEVCLFLIKKGAKPNNMQTAIQNARKHNWTHVVKYFDLSHSLQQLLDEIHAVDDSSISGVLATKAFDPSIDIYSISGKHFFDEAMRSGNLSYVSGLLAIENTHYLASKAADRFVSAVNIVRCAVTRHRLAIDQHLLSDMASAILKSEAVDASAKSSAKYILEVVNNRHSDRHMIDSEFGRRCLIPGVNSLEEKAKIAQKFSKTLINHRDKYERSLLRQLLAGPSQPKDEAVNFLINNGARIFLGDLRLALDFSDQKIALSLLKELFSHLEDLLCDVVSADFFNKPYVLDCGHTLDESTCNGLKQPRSDFCEYERIGAFSLGSPYVLPAKQCPHCLKIYEEKVLSTFTQRLVKLITHQDDTTPEAFVELIDEAIQANASNTNPILLKEVLRQNVLDSVTHEGWVKLV
ncbi:MAG: hypothetical protein H7A39_05110 [Chlamydiales bacterium]|nr:hypothetical protein [Chlamydiales bacterium]